MRKITFTSLFLLLAVLGCTPEEEKVVATVGSEEIQVKDFLTVYRPKAYESEEAEMEAKLKALDNIINEKLLVAEARSRGWGKDTSDETISKDFQQVKRRAMEAALYKKLVLDKSKPSSAEIKRYYNAEKELLELRLIHVEKEDMANMVSERFDSGVPFDTLFNKFSTKERIPPGGNIGSIPLAQFYQDEESFNQLSSLEEGQITEPIENKRGGFDIYLLVSMSQKEDVPPLAEREEEIKNWLQRIKGAQLSTEVLDELFEEAKVEYNQAGLELLTKPRNQLTPADLSTWTIKMKGNVTDSIGSMLDLYPNDTTPIQAAYLEDAAKYQAQTKVLKNAALKRNLDRDKTVKEAIENYIDAQIRNRLYEEEIRSKVKVSDEEIKAYYDEHPEEFNFPERRTLAIIRTPSYSNIQQAHALLQSGKPFKEVAREFSDHTSKDRGGIIGSKRADDREYKPFVEQAFKLSKGQFSRPFEVANGFGIVKVISIQEPFTREFDDEKGRIERKLRRNKEMALKTEYLAELREKISIEINEELLAKIAKLAEEEEKEEEEKPESNKNK
ncbi:hypothetical protein GF359_05275 [candidate division WOR-3 bacterium]|uniref:PpiC domain-containing protein n=1 Tax=candidate division WOR-3 bacterium TaxID=2052148 RepID=A0A9D5K940_UNCW3|nr:hypothetical protein [candidate division WOR-3 bacterium]MBD3364607.1 hypothetical protein [candidate division WOR-3 bacterium]